MAEQCQVAVRLRACSGPVARFFRDEGGQDLIEYALLTMFVGLAGIAVLNAIVGGLGNGYNNWTSGTNVIWESPPPAGS